MKGFVFPLVFGLGLTGFTAFAGLDTFIIEDSGVEVIDDYDNKDTNKTNNNENNNNQNNNNENNGNEPVDPPKPEELGELPYEYKSSTLDIKIYTENIKVKHMTKNKQMDTLVYCADVTILDKDYNHLRGRFAKGSHDSPYFGKNIENKTSEIAEDGNAIFAISGDNYGKQEKGYVVRNGTEFRDTVNSNDREDLVIWKDGSFDSFREKNVPLENIMNNKEHGGAWQVFSFGPTLVLDSKVNVSENAEVKVFTKEIGNQRCSIGILEPFHYFIAICDGRLADSYGMSLYEMGTFMQQHGCKIAYNLDGGGSATIWYKGKVLNRPNTYGDDDIGERDISDIILFK